MKIDDRSLVSETDSLLDQMMIESFVESIHYSNKLEEINVPLDRCYELCIGTYDTTENN